MLATPQLLPSTWDSEAERLLWADLCQKSFWHFCDYAMGYGNNPAFTWWTERLHRPFCDWFQQNALEWLANRRERRTAPIHLMVIVMREFGKTMIITKAGTLWLHLQDPNISSYIGSMSVRRANDFYEPLKSILDGSDPNARFSWLYGNWFDPKRTWSATQLVHAARTNVARSEPSIGTWGVETGLTGTHPDHGNLDDPISYEKIAEDSSWLEKINRHMTNLVPVFRADCFFVYTGTRYHDADAIGEALRAEGALSVDGMQTPRIVPVPTGKWRVYFMAARDADGKPVFPENWPESRMKYYERRNPMEFAAQLMNDPNVGSHVPLVAEQLDNLWVDRREVPRDLRYSIHIDTAFKSRESMNRGDESVIQLWGHTRDGSGDVFYLEGYGSSIWRIEDFNNQLVILLQRLRRERRWPYVLTDEAEVGGKYGTWEMTLQSWCHGAGLVAPHIELLSRGGRKKVNRILEACSYWVGNHVRLVRGAPGVDRLIDQMLRIGTSAHDDWSDAGADVFHPKIYLPARRVGATDEQPLLARPANDDLSRLLAEEDELRDWGREPIR